MSKFVQGQPKPAESGRKAGVANKRSQLLAELLEGAGLLIPEKLVELLPKLSPDKQADVLLELMAFVFPKRKAVEHTMLDQREEDESEPIIINFISAKSHQVESRTVVGKEKVIERWKREKPGEQEGWVEGGSTGVDS